LPEPLVEPDEPLDPPLAPELEPLPDPEEPLVPLEPPEPLLEPEAPLDPPLEPELEPLLDPPTDESGPLFGPEPLSSDWPQANISEVASTARNGAAFGDLIGLYMSICSINWPGLAHRLGGCRGIIGSRKACALVVTKVCWDRQFATQAERELSQYNIDP
jgi:hypothetical protein